MTAGLVVPAILLLAACGAGEKPVALPGSGDEHARARMVVERTDLTPGREAWLGITFTIEPGWHLYWKGLNDTGAGIDIKLTGPAGFELGEPRWPAPKRHVSPGDILDHIYEERVTLLVPVKVPGDARPGSTARFGAEINWMVCSDVCLVGGATVSLSVPVSARAGGGEPAPSADAPLFAEARARLPGPIPKENPPVTVEWKDGAAVIRAPGMERMAFYPAEGFAGFESVLRAGEAKGDTLVLKLNPYTDGPVRLVGVLEATRRKPAPPSIFAIEAMPPTPGGTPGGE